MQAIQPLEVFLRHCVSFREGTGTAKREKGGRVEGERSAVECSLCIQMGLREEFVKGREEDQGKGGKIAAKGDGRWRAQRPIL